RAARILRVLTDAEAHMLPLAHSRRLEGPAGREQQRHVRVAEPEGREPVELLCQIEREVSSGDGGVDDGLGRQIFLGQCGVRVRGESLRESLDPARVDGETGRRTMTAEAGEVLRASRERAVQVEAAARAP